MAKWFGKIGYATTQETVPGVWEDVIEERNYYGDTVRNVRRLENAQKINDDIAVAVDISIVADPFAYNNFHTMKYVEYMGNKWKVASVDPQYPRLILSLGGLYNGEEPTGTTDTP